MVNRDNVNEYDATQKLQAIRDALLSKNHITKILAVVWMIVMYKK